MSSQGDSANYVDNAIYFDSLLLDSMALCNI